jgi:LmbE family N-acetylglucosaminyl deacetylase
MAAQASAAGHAGLGVTVFAAPPAGALSAYAQHLHTRWGQPDALQGNAMRCAEERAALAILGLGMALLPYADAIYREARYGSWDDILGPVHADEAGLAVDLAAGLDSLLRERGTADTTIYAPLGLGRHVDHRLVHAAARSLEGQGWAVCYYEDYPYAERPDAHAARFAEIGRTPGATAIAEYCDIGAGIETKIRAIAAYPSQMSSLFPSMEAMPSAVRAYAAQVAADWARESPPPGPAPQYAERYWRLVAG